MSEGYDNMPLWTAVPYGSTFLIVGGTAVYKYAPSSDTWKEMPERTSVARSQGIAAMLVDIDTFPSC